MAEEPKVSVLLPVRDAAPHLPFCRRTLERQTLAGYEVIAVDDGSTDGSGEFLDRWAGEDPRVVVLHRPARGLVEALNGGLARCRAPLVARMDADDACHPRRLELQAAFLDAHPEVAVAGCLVRHVPVHRVGGGMRRYQRWLNSLTTHEAMARERFVESPVAHPSAVIRRAVLEEAGGWRDEGWPEDHDLWLRLFEAGVRFGKVPRLLYFWRDHPQRLTRTDPRYAKGAFYAMKAYFLARGPLAAAREAVIWGAGPTGRLLARELRHRGVGLAGFVEIDPRKVGRTVGGAPVVGPGSLEGLVTPRTVVLAAVAAWGGRERIRAELTARGLVEGRDFWCVA